MKVIFLDIDGVITSARTGWYNFDIYAIHFLRWICKKSGAKIVISSTWRLNHGEDFWKPIFGEHLHPDFKTPILRERHDDNGLKITQTRGTEIKMWLNQHEEIESYLILDDDLDMLPHQLGFLIHTDSMNGIMFEDFVKIKDFFGVKEFLKEEAVIHIHENMFDNKKTKVA